MASNQQIMSDLKVIMDTDHNLELLNTYKGVPFICKAKVIGLEGDKARLYTTDAAIISLTFDQKTRVLGSDYFEPSVARVVDVNVVAGQVTLSDFSFMGAKLGERMIVRVEPKEATQVTLHIGNKVLDAHMADLSISGMGVRVAESSYTPLLKPGGSIQMDINLPKGAVQMDGTILSVTKSGDDYRLSIRFGANSQEKVKIFRYLIDRRSEIENELKQAYETARKSPGAAA